MDRALQPVHRDVHTCYSNNATMLKKKSIELSASIDQDFRPDRITQCGLTGGITAMAYDPVQLLYAVGTDTGMVHVMGAGEIRGLLDPNPKHKTPSVPIRHLRFVTSVYLVSIDDRSCIVVWALDSRSEWARYQSPFGVMSCWTDPSMDWLFMGHHNGEITAFDIDRGRPTAYKVANLERIVDPKMTTGAVLNLSIHPRDPATMLICYRQVAIVWNLATKEIAFDLPYEFPLTDAVWHPSGSHIVTSHVNGFVVFWDGQKGVRLGARTAFPTSVGSMDIIQDRIPERLAWCCTDYPTETFLLVWGGKTINCIEYGNTPTVVATSYDSMGNFFKNPQVSQRDLVVSSPIDLAQLIPKAGNPHFQGAYNPSHIVLHAGGQLLCVALPTMHVLTIDSVVLPPALCWRSSPISYIDSLSIARSQWIGMMAAAQPNTHVIGGNSATQPLRKLQLASVLCLGHSNGTVKLFDATRADFRDYRVLSTSVAHLDPERPVEKVTRVSVGREVGEMSIAVASGTIFLTAFGKNQRLQEPGPPAPQLEITNVEHLVLPELHQGFIPQWMYKGPGVPVTALCNSNIGFVASAYENGKIVVIDKRGPAVILDETIKGAACFLQFGIVAVGNDPFSSILLAVGTTVGSIHIYRIVPRANGGYQILPSSKDTLSFSVGKDPITQLVFVSTKDGRSAEAVPETMARLASGLQVQGAILGTSVQDAKLFQLTGPKMGKKLGSKNFDTPLISATFASLHSGNAAALVTINIKGRCAFYGLPALTNMSSYQLPATPTGSHVLVTEMGDAFIPYDRDAHAGQVLRLFGTDQAAKDDELWVLKRRVPARPAISTVHWMTGKKFVKPSDLDDIIGGKHRGKSKRARHQLVSEQGVVEPTDDQRKAALSNLSSHPKPRSKMSQETWGQTFAKYYENAENTVNGALDEAMESLSSGRKQVQSSATKGILGSMFGF